MEHGIDVEGRQKKVAVMYDEQDFIAAAKIADKLRSEGNIASLYVKPKKMGKFLNKLEERKYDGFVNVTNGGDVSWF
jgi:histidyl-tRNA synthetase